MSTARNTCKLNFCIPLIFSNIAGDSGDGGAGGGRTGATGADGASGPSVSKIYQALHCPCNNMNLWFENTKSSLQHMYVVTEGGGSDFIITNNKIENIIMSKNIYKDVPDK